MRRTYCSANYLNFPLPPLHVKPFFLLILDIRVVDARFDAAIAHRLDAFSNRFCILQKCEVDVRDGLDQNTFLVRQYMIPLSFL